MLQNIWTALEEEEIQIFGITPAFCSKLLKWLLKWVNTRLLIYLIAVNYLNNTLVQSLIINLLLWISLLLQMVKKSLLSKSVEWFVCWISTKESNLGYTFLSLFCSWFFSSFSHNSFHTFHTVFCFECSPDAAFIFSRLLKPPHVPPREGWEPLIALFFVSFRIPGGTEEGLSSVYCLQCTGWKASIWRGISPALLLNRAIQVSLFPIRLQFAIIFKRTQDGVHLKALKGFHHSFFFSTSFFSSVRTVN